MTVEKPSQRNLIDFLTNRTGGSIRHKNITAIECFHALSDLYRAWEKYHEAMLLAAERRGEVKGMREAAVILDSLYLDLKKRSYPPPEWIMNTGQTAPRSFSRTCSRAR